MTWEQFDFDGDGCISEADKTAALARFQAAFACEAGSECYDEGLDLSDPHGIITATDFATARAGIELFMGTGCNEAPVEIDDGA